MEDILLSFDTTIRNNSHLGTRAEEVAKGKRRISNVSSGVFSLNINLKINSLRKKTVANLIFH